MDSPCEIFGMHLEYMVFQITADRIKQWIQSRINQR